jgi:hypothetical protein
LEAVNQKLGISFFVGATLAARMKAFPGCAVGNAVPKGRARGRAFEPP